MTVENYKSNTKEKMYFIRALNHIMEYKETLDEAQKYAFDNMNWKPKLYQKIKSENIEPNKNYVLVSQYSKWISDDWNDGYTETTYKDTVVNSKTLEEKIIQEIKSGTTKFDLGEEIPLKATKNVLKNYLG